MLEEMEDDLIELVEEKSIEPDTDADRINGAWHLCVHDPAPIELALVNLLRPGTLGTSGLNTGMSLLSVSMI